ncbi:hypothetical protein CCP4SC76_4570001 [Gammaproteobacteria bacterium]
MVYLLGGFGTIASNLGGHLPATRVLEGAAAGAFIFSIACYVGAALAPVVAMAYDTLTNSLTDDMLTPSHQAATSPPASGAP